MKNDEVIKHYVENYNYVDNEYEYTREQLLIIIKAYEDALRQLEDGIEYYDGKYDYVTIGLEARSCHCSMFYCHAEFVINGVSEDENGNEIKEELSSTLNDNGLISALLKIKGDK